MMSSPAEANVDPCAAANAAAELPVPDSPEARIDHLQGMVPALLQELEMQLAWRAAWETGEEITGTDQELQWDPPTAPTMPMRPTQPEHFSVTPAEANTEWGSSPA